MRKKIIALFLLYALQFIATACSPCNCELEIYEKTYIGVQTTPYDTSGFQNTVSENNIPKNTFGLTIQLEFEQKQIAKHTNKLNIGSFGFNSALACDCRPPEFVVDDPTVAIEILVTDVLQNNTQEVTKNFTVPNFQNEAIPFATFFQNRSEWMDGFQLDLSIVENIPDTAIFTVNVLLESGTILTKSTNTITFI